MADRAPAELLVTPDVRAVLVELLAAALLADLQDEESPPGDAATPRPREPGRAPPEPPPVDDGQVDEGGDPARFV